MDGSLNLHGFAASIVVSLATGAGALPVLFIRKISDRVPSSSSLPRYFSAQRSSQC
jgi:zinc transporter ZupT